MLNLLFILGLSAAQTYVLSVLARVAATKWGVLDRPDGNRKLHVEPMPRLGGVAIYLGFVCTIVEAAWWGLGGDVTPDAVSRIRLLTGTAGLLCGVGLWDDLVGLRPRTKLAFQVLAVLPFVIFSRHVTAVSLLGFSADLGWMGIPLTLLWLVGCANVINLIDGLDGLAGGIVLIVSLAVTALAVHCGLPIMALVSLTLAGSTGGFLIHNWPPARIFMGDSGSLPLGFLLGALTIEVALTPTATLALGIPLVLMSVPLFDTAMAILRRVLNGRSIGQADRQHFHHCLRDRGLSTRQCLLALGGMCLAMGLAVVTSTVFQRDSIAIIACLSLLSLVVRGKWFGHHELSQLAACIRSLASNFAEAPRSTGAQIRLAPIPDAAHVGPPEGWRLLKTLD